MVFTSGSTGESKGAVLSVGALLRKFRALRQGYRTLVFLQLDHIGGINTAFYESLLKDPRRPLFNKALQGTYPPGSTWKLATGIIGLQDSVVTFKDKMPQPCTGYFYFGNNMWRCWDKRGHGYTDLTSAIAQSCDVYFYQLGLKLGLTRLVAGGVALGFKSKSGIDLPEESRPKFPPAERMPPFS